MAVLANKYSCLPANCIYQQHHFVFDFIISNYDSPDLCVCSGVFNSVTLKAVAIRLLCPWDFAGKNTGEVCHILQGIFLTQGSNPPPLCFLHCRWIIYCCIIGEALFCLLQKKPEAYFLNANLHLYLITYIKCHFILTYCFTLL